MTNFETRKRCRQSKFQSDSSGITDASRSPSDEKGAPYRQSAHGRERAGENVFDAPRRNRSSRFHCGPESRLVASAPNGDERGRLRPTRDYITFQPVYINFMLPLAGIRGVWPVRLADITRIGTANGHALEWQDLPEDSYVYGCLTQWGAYADYQANECLVPPSTPKDGSTGGHGVHGARGGPNRS